MSHEQDAPAPPIVADNVSDLIDPQQPHTPSALGTPLLDALCVYARLLGQNITANELTTGLPVFAGDLPDEFLKRALRNVGYVGTVRQSNKIPDKFLPICVALHDGTYTVIIRREQHDYVLADTALDGGERIVGAAVLNNLFAGRTIEILPDLEDLQRRHTGVSFRGHWFWGRFRTQGRLVFEIIIGSLIANILAVAVSLFSLQVYDRVIPNQSETTLWVLVIGAAIALMFEATLRITRSFLLDSVGKTIELDLSSFLFQRFQGMRLSSRPASAGSLVYMLREFSSVREFFTAATVGSVADIPFVVVFLLLIYGIAGNVVWIIVVAGILIVLPNLFMQGRLSRLSEEMLGGTSASGRLLTEVAYGQETVKTVRGEAFFQRKWEDINTLTAVKTTQQRAISSTLSYLSAAIQQASYVSAVVAGTYMVFAGEFTIGTIIAVSILSSRTLAPITQLSGALSRWQQMKASLKGLDSIARSEQERPVDRHFARRPVLYGDIELEGVKFKYTKDDAEALSIHSLAIKPGESIAILGANGSGKSTLLKILSGIFSITSGSVTIDGLDFRQTDPEDIRANIGYLPQDVKLFNGTLRDNLNMGSARWSEQELFDALEFAGLGGFVKEHARGLDLIITDGGEGISIGQRQSLGVARLYLQQQNVIIMDEPTASLDQTLEKQLIARLQTWLQQRTCIIATHRMPILALVERVVVLHKGQIALDDTKNIVLDKLRGG